MSIQDIERTSPEWNSLWVFFGGHLHQDYDVHGSGWDAVRTYSTRANEQHRQSAAAAIHRLLTMFDEERLSEAAEWLGMDYYPPADGYTYRQWLEEVASFLEGESAR